MSSKNGSYKRVGWPVLEKKEEGGGGRRRSQCCVELLVVTKEKAWKFSCRGKKGLTLVSIFGIRYLSPSAGGKV